MIYLFEKVTIPANKLTDKYLLEIAACSNDGFI